MIYAADGSFLYSALGLQQLLLAGLFAKIQEGLFFLATASVSNGEKGIEKNATRQPVVCRSAETLPDIEFPEINA